MEKALDNRTRLYGIRDRLFYGEISYEQAKAEAEPIIAEINKKAVELGKKYGMKPQLVSFQSIMR
jgi:hypothetical protein